MYFSLVSTDILELEPSLTYFPGPGQFGDISRSVDTRGHEGTAGYPVSQMLNCDTLYYPSHTSHHSPPSPDQGVSRVEYYSISLRLTSKYQIEIRTSYHI